MKKSHSTSAIASANGGIVHNRKSLNTSASAKLSSKIKKKYSRKKVADDVNNKGLASVDHKLKNGNGKLKSTTNHEELCRLAETELKRLESEKLMDMKSKMNFIYHVFIYFFFKLKNNFVSSGND